MGAARDGRWDCGVEEEGSGKRPSDSEPRARIPVVLGGRDHRVASHSCCMTLGKCLPPSGPQFTLPWKDIGFHRLRPCLPLIRIKSRRRERPKAGPQSPESTYLLLASESHHHPPSPSPGLICPFSHSINFLLHPLHQQNKTKLRGTGTYQGQHTGCRALAHPRSRWTLLTLLGSKVHP